IQLEAYLTLMGKYRTFSTKIITFDDLHDPGDSKSHKCSCHGNVLLGNTATRKIPGITRVPGTNQRPKWKEGSCQHSALIILLIGNLLFFQPCSSSSITTIAPLSDIDAHASGLDLTLNAEPNTQFTTQEAANNSFALTASLNCSRPSSDEFPEDLFTKEQRQNGAIAIHFIVAFLMLYALLLVCDEYFVPAVECICEELHVPHSIAGATFMAISTSAPELFTNVIGTFVTKGDLGLGTIVGSAVFNILAVGSCVGIGANFAPTQTSTAIAGTSHKRNKRKGIPLDWWSLTRDSAFYLISVVALIIVLLDGRVYWHEALMFLVIYGLYILGMELQTMCYDTQCKEWVSTLLEKVQHVFCSSKASSRKLSSVIQKVMGTNDEHERAPLLKKDSMLARYDSGTPLVGDNEGGQYSSYQSILPKNSRKVSLAEVLTTNDASLHDSNSYSSTDSRSSLSSVSSSVMVLTAVKDVCTFPLRFLMAWTIPDCRKQKMRKWCLLSLIGCVVWIGGLSYVISWMVCIIGGTLNIPDSVSGLTFLAAGTSLPEVLSSVIVARQGFGSMAFSNSIGSNTFDVLGDLNILQFC
ncbi:Sodium/potassium/calcium exchanger 5, partial [Orchesella cincta]